MIAFRAPTRDEEIEIRFFSYRFHSECTHPRYERRSYGDRFELVGVGGRSDLCPACLEDHDPGDEDRR